MKASSTASSALTAPLMGLDLLAALGVVVIWGLNFVAMKFSLRDFTPFQLGTFRYVFAVLPLLFFIKKPQLSWRWRSHATRCWQTRWCGSSTRPTWWCSTRVTW